MAASKTTNKDVDRTSAAKRDFFVGSVNSLKTSHLARHFFPEPVLSFVNVPSGMSSQEKPSQKKTNQPSRPAFREFTLHLFDLSWRLFGSMLAPLFVGLYIDSKQEGSGQGFALGGFLIGMVCGVLVMRQVIRKMADRSQ